MIYVYLLILAVLIIIVQGFFVYNLYHQSKQLEDFIAEVEKREAKIYEDAEKYYIAFLQLFMNADSEISRIDKRGTFSSDDEVGFAFKVIKTCIGNVVQKLKELKEEQNNNEENEVNNDKD